MHNIFLNKLKKKFLNNSLEILQFVNMLGININKHFYNYLLDISDTKIHKSKQIARKKAHELICIVTETQKYKFSKTYIQID